MLKDGLWIVLDDGYGQLWIVHPDLALVSHPPERIYDLPLVLR